MNKTKIDWADYTWNPVTGCLHGCEYCYAEKIARRFGGGKNDKAIHYLGEPMYKQKKNGLAAYGSDMMIDPYPCGFAPTFHKYRLDEPQEVKKSQRIFVVSMGDLFGDWVPGDWIEEVFRACEDAPQHKYLFLTKNPKGLRYPFHQYFNNKNWWIGTSVTRISELKRVQYLIDETTERTNRFLSIEPLLGDLGYMSELVRYYKWVIIGQQTNPDKLPKGEWVQLIIDQCRVANVPVFVKSPLYEKFPIQEWPEGLKKESEG